ncbi:MULTISPECIES: RNA-binding S4 domain-containing protein [Terrabacteria group]|uniref:RNA-binding S4 domain-containing protein n=1 Tax=Bacillati TaxID=1783272 RepID=UPI00193A6BAF|nr:MULTISPECIES: RNA-binding S4 domain-containing protein [Terrabacteria group]MBW9212513.1 RNA-binding S4 domain-containing protein [Trueperella sp. zg.1013]QRG86735.1 RNA-binding S4 domain-containing protein [Bulleidia sp. zg-1006]
MRVDKFLKISRILKRRTISKELALHERIKINDKIVKPSHEVKVGDVVEIQYGLRVLAVRVLSMQEKTRKADAAEMYEVVYEKHLNLDE